MRLETQPESPDPSLYDNARGWLKIKTKATRQPAIWIPVTCKVTYHCNSVFLAVTPVDGIGTQDVWRTRVWFEDPGLNLCDDQPPAEQLAAYYEAKRKARLEAAGFIEEDEE